MHSEQDYLNISRLKHLLKTLKRSKVSDSSETETSDTEHHPNLAPLCLSSVCGTY